MNKLHEIQIDRIIPDPNQPRKHFEPELMRELAESIKFYGLIQPILVKPNDPDISPIDENQTYTIIAGERRYRASQIAGQETVDVLIRESNDSLEVSLIENLQRKDLNKIEEAAAIKHIMEVKGYTQEQMAKVLSKSRPYIANALRILNLSPQLQQALIDEKISDAHARVLVGIREEQERIKLLDKIIGEKMSVRETEKYSKKLREKKDIFLEDALEKLSDVLDCKVYTQGDAHKGTLCISYSSEEQLGSLIDALSKLG